MPLSGLFITLFDEKTLKLYLSKGIYGFQMPPIHGEVPKRSKHYAALADYACAREGAHIFFFLKRKIIYGGQIVGSKEYGAFYLNGPYSPLGRRANSKVCWDESSRYTPTGNPGIFRRSQDGKEVCQPYLLMFKDKIGLKGHVIKSDQLYFELGKYPYPLPSNSIVGMGFCTLAPGETEIALSLLEKEPIDCIEPYTDEDIELLCQPPPFSPEYSISSMKEATSEDHLKVSIIANPQLLPEFLQPKNAVICREVPLSPFKPYRWMDRADICYYSDDLIGYGTIPNIVIEVKNKKCGKNEIEQLIRYIKWLYKVLGDEVNKIEFYLIAPTVSIKAKSEILPKFKNKIKFYEFRSY